MSHSSLLLKLRQQQSQPQLAPESKQCLPVAISARTISRQLALNFIFINCPKLSATDWTVLSDWLLAGTSPSDKYVRPTKRELYDPLMQYLMDRYGFELARWKSYTIDTHMTLQDQKELYKWTQDLNNLVIALC